jgi:hypothetical protein
VVKVLYKLRKRAYCKTVFRNKGNVMRQRTLWLRIIALVLYMGVIGMQIDQAMAAAVGGTTRDYPDGFNEQFTNGASNWAVVKGAWYVGGGQIRGYGVTKGYSKVLFSKATYANFDYMARMRRTGCSNCPNELILRDTGSRAVYFWYNNMGYYSISACAGASCTTWKKATATTAIIRGGYNVLRVVAIGNYYSFYINNILLARGNASGFTSGYVGLDFFSWVTSGNYLEVDYAILSRK